MKNNPQRSLALISTSVLLASSTWFSGTAATPQLRHLWGLNDVQCAWLTISVQLGFILGTFCYALLNLSDIFNARRVFFISALFGALFNAAFAELSNGLEAALIFRMLTGFTLAGIYPVGMKLIAQWFRSGLGWRLGILVGALTLGTAFPYLIMALGAEWEWSKLMLVASGLALAGGLIVWLLVQDGPYLSSASRFEPRIVFQIFKIRSFRLQALGYFGHMWELYAFWALVASYLAASYAHKGSELLGSVSLITFVVIGIGCLGCILGGWISRRYGEKAVASFCLSISGILCLSSGLLFTLPDIVVGVLVLLWGIFVISDSPQFSALAAHYCPPEYTGTALTIQNGIGFGITVLSIQLIAWIGQTIGWQWAFVFLAPGPIIGIMAMIRLSRIRPC